MSRASYEVSLDVVLCGRVARNDHGQLEWQVAHLRECAAASGCPHVTVLTDVGGTGPGQELLDRLCAADAVVGWDASRLSRRPEHFLTVYRRLAAAGGRRSRPRAQAVRRRRALLVGPGDDGRADPPRDRAGAAREARRADPARHRRREGPPGWAAITGPIGNVPLPDRQEPPREGVPDAIQTPHRLDPASHRHGLVLWDLVDHIHVRGSSRVF